MSASSENEFRSDLRDLYENIYIPSKSNARPNTSYASWSWYVRDRFQLIEGVDFIKIRKEGRYGTVDIRLNESARAQIENRLRAPLQFSAKRKRAMAEIEAGERKCITCSEIRPLAFFERNRKMKDADVGAYIGRCKPCRLAQKAEHRTSRSQTLEGSLIPVLCNIRQRSRKRGWDCNLTIQELVQIWNSQGGICYHTGRPMVFQRVARAGHKTGLGGTGLRCDPNIVSPDRLDSNLPYEKSNLVLCRWIANLLKSDLEIDLFVTTCQEVVDTANRRSCP